MKAICSLLSLFIAILVISSCSSDERTENLENKPGYLLFFEALSAECGNAYPGDVIVQPETLNMFKEADKMVMHVKECTENTIYIPFHRQNEDTGEWNSSRIWIITLHEDGLELRHDHRRPDGSEESETMYGGYSVEDGDENIQLFQSLPGTEDAGGEFRGWRIEYFPGEHFTYGTIWRDEWNLMIEFDLSEPVDVPPVPWGYE
ncbi:MAG: hypothetical protein JJU13_15640 [Balneolaceae bacterium]|nr:hypothetical protein [Balneolaceae bacterium]